MNIKFLILGFLLSGIFGCAGAPVITPPEVGRGVGIYHRVAPKETLWRISQMYNVDLDDIARANHIPDAASIEKGQMIFIPGVTSEPAQVSTGLSPESNFAWPVRGRIVSYYGSTLNSHINKGIDIQAHSSDDILASSSGRVTFSDSLRGYGQTIIIEHARGISTVYSGDLEGFTRLGEWVSTGSAIAKVARNGATTVHFEVRRGYRSQNPLYYLP